VSRGQEWQLTSVQLKPYRHDPKIVGDLSDVLTLQDVI